MMPSKKAWFVLMTLMAFVIVGCSGLPAGSSTGGGGGGNTGGGGGNGAPSTFTIGGTITGLTGTGLVLLNNGGDSLTVSANATTFTFATAVKSGGAYAVTVGTQPTNPSQTCTVTNGSGTASANVTNVQIACTTAQVTVGGTITGLAGSGLVLVNNGGDALTVTGTGIVNYTFKTPLTLGGLYNVTVQTQPSNPTQVCSVANGSGAASANVTNVNITCSSKYSIGGTVTGLSGTGLVLQNNGLDNLTITANGTFTFATLVPGTYDVTVLTQPSGPTQTCLVTNASGTATANVTNVSINCSSGFTIGGTVSGLSGAGLVLQDNGGDNLTIVGTGSVKFTFPTLVTGAYAVTVKAQPTNPSQACTVIANGTGTAAAPVTNVQISCTAVYTIGGTVSGLLGTGLTLEDTLGGGTVLDQLAVSGTGAVNFTFAIPAPINSNYAVSVVTQPTNPAQNCFVNNGSGKVVGAITTVQVVCQQPAWTISGVQVGLVTLAYDGVTKLAGGFTELINNGGDNIYVTGNNVGFSFPTGVTNNGQYNVNVFLEPTSQPQPCGAFFYTGVATANVDSVIIDCQHNDWAWMFGPNTNGTYGPYGTLQLPPPPSPAQDTNTPGGRDFAATWSPSPTANPANLKWIYGGWGLPVQGASPPYLPYFMGDLWVFWPGMGSGGQTGIWVPADLPTTNVKNPTTGVITVSADTVFDQIPGNYSVGTNVTDPPYTDPGGNIVVKYHPAYPGARWGSVTWTDASGNLYLFGGQGNSRSAQGLLNDLWKFTPGQYDGPNAASNYFGSDTYLGTWTILDPTRLDPVNVATIATYPGSRWGAAYCTDSAGTLWMFGGQGYDSAGNIGLLNDLWTYSGGTWTLVANSTNSTIGQHNGVYGTLGTAAAGNFPGGRQTAVLWADNLGNLWLFGGLGLDSIGTQNPGNAGTLPDGSTPQGALLNDLWQYNISTQQWTWMSGGGATGLAEQIGLYGTQQVPAAGFFPGSRWGASGWSDSNGNLWFFGGWGWASSLSQGTGFLDDIWEYHTTGPNKGLWTWWKGSSNVNEAGNYPTYLPVWWGVPFVRNQPGGRRGVALWQQDTTENIWVFGGQGFDSKGSNGYLGDFWTYLPFPY